MDKQLTVRFNGESVEIPAGTSIAQLLESTNIRRELVAVEVNMEIVTRDAHDSFTLSDGDVVEAVTLVGGG